MKWTFVPKEDLFELAAVIACVFAAYMSWKLDSLYGLLAILVFGGLVAYFYTKKNRARWCAECNRRMVYGTESSTTSSDYEVVYECPKCGKRNRAGIETEYPSK